MGRVVGKVYKTKGKGGRPGNKDPKDEKQEAATAKAAGDGEAGTTKESE